MEIIHREGRKSIFKVFKVFHLFSKLNSLKLTSTELIDAKLRKLNRKEKNLPSGDFSFLSVVKLSLQNVAKLNFTSSFGATDFTKSYFNEWKLFTTTRSFIVFNKSKMFAQKGRQKRRKRKVFMLINNLIA